MASNNNQGGQGTQQGGQSNRGFASMDSERQREIASEGGRAAHASGNAHEFDSQEAREAGSKNQGGNQGGNNIQGGNTSQGSQGTRGQANQDQGGSSSGSRSGSSEQHAQDGRQSHKNDR